jgi:ABC-type sugar transport system substrate-binding protein
MADDLERAATGQISRRRLLTMAGAAAGGLLVSPAVDLANETRAWAGTLGATSLTNKKVGVANPVTVEVLTEFYKDMRLQAHTRGNGERVNVLNSNLNSVLQHTQVELLIAQRYNGMVMFVLQATGWDDAVRRAVKQGMCVIDHSASAITGCTQCVVLNQYAAGYAVGQAAAHWIANHKGGKAQVALLEILNDPQLMQRGQGQAAAIAKFSPGSTIVAKAAAQTTAQATPAVSAILQAHPDISVILSAGDDPGIAAYSEVTASGRKDPSSFYIGSCDGTSVVLQYIGQNTIYQSTWNFMFSYSAVQLERDMEKFFRGQSIPGTRVQAGLLITRANVAALTNISNHPLAAKNQHYYKKFAKYYNQHLRTGQGAQNLKH